eukprot:jgi/Tetstr1/464179/TSEL_008984.t1
MTRGGKAAPTPHVPMPLIGTADFPRDLLSKREYVLGKARKGCDDSAPFKLQPVQQFVSTYMSPLTPYKSILLFHGTGVGKTCAAVQAAELQGGSTRRTLVLVPASIQGGFENNVYNSSRATPGRVSEASRFQCTGSAYYTRDLEALSQKALKKAQRARGRRRYEFAGHDKFANTIEVIEARARRDFAALGDAAVQAEIDSTLRALYDNRLIVVDEAHELRSETGKKPSYMRLRQVLAACEGCRLILMSATPMFNRATEIVDLVNLMRVNDRAAPISAKDLFDKDDALTGPGRRALREALQGRVSHMTYEDPASFPAALRPSDAGIKGAAWTPPSRTREGAVIPPNKRLRKGGEYELFHSRLSEEQARSYGLAELKTPGAMMTAMQLENVCYDGSSAAANEEALYKAFKKVPGSGGRVLRYSGDVRYLHPSNVDRYAPKIGAATRLMKRADGLCFLYSNFRASGVYPTAIALEEMGFLPHSGRAILHDAPALGAASAPRYVVITKDDETSDAMSVSDKVEAVNALSEDPANPIRVVLGTETAAQGLDFKRVREVHVLEPWWNMSRIRQVIGRGVRRCSHVALPESKRNTTVYLHCTTRSGDRETLDQRVYREALNKNDAVRGVEAVLAEAAVDCGLYETRAASAPPPQVSSQNTDVAVRRDGSLPVKCDIKWPKPGDRQDASTLHPYVYKNMVDLLAFDVKDALEGKRAATFAELAKATGADELVLSLALTTLMNPLLSWRWLGGRSLVYRGDMYALVPDYMANHPFTLVEARMGFLFGRNPEARL